MKAKTKPVRQGFAGPDESHKITIRFPTEEHAKQFAWDNGDEMSVTWTVGNTIVIEGKTQPVARMWMRAIRCGALRGN